MTSSGPEAAWPRKGTNPRDKAHKAAREQIIAFFSQMNNSQGQKNADRYNTD